MKLILHDNSDYSKSYLSVLLVKFQVSYLKSNKIVMNNDHVY